MADISQGIDSYFWLSLITVFCTGLNVFVHYAYRSKCKKCKLGCIEIERDIEVEEREDAITAAAAAANPPTTNKPLEPHTT